VILTHRFAKPVVALLCTIPFLVFVWRWETNRLGINPLEAGARYTGECVIRLLLITLCITPLRRIPGLANLIRFRRMLGLFAFFYACVHLLHYLWLDKAWIWEIIWEDFRLRRFYIFGWIAFLLMFPLALTSTNWSVRFLGGKRWQLLHRLIYLSAASGITHYYLQDKLPAPMSITYFKVLAALLAIRIFFYVRKRLSARAPHPAAAVRKSVK
jgi:sulfoxide reductase heme-binding subunit YedZ